MNCLLNGHWTLFLLLIFWNKVHASDQDESNGNDEVPFEKCLGSEAEVKRVMVSGCTKNELCTFHDNQKHGFLSLDFVPMKQHNRLVASAKVRLMSMVEVNAIDDYDVCDYYMECPVMEGVESRFNSTDVKIAVPWYVPSAVLREVMITAQLKDKDTNVVVACVHVKATIKS